jgi:hypothetical protein
VNSEQYSVDILKHKHNTGTQATSQPTARNINNNNTTTTTNRERSERGLCPIKNMSPKKYVTKNYVTKKIMSPKIMSPKNYVTKNYVTKKIMSPKKKIFDILLHA